MIGIDVYAAALTVFFGYDAATALYEKKKHSTMGWLEDPKAHAQAVAGICRKWAVRTPVLRIRKPCRYLLIDRIRGKYGKTMVQSWQRAGCILGLLDAGGRENEDAAERAMSACLKENGTWSFPVNRIDYAMLAYAVLRAEKDPARVKPAMDAMLKCLDDNLCADGMLSYSVGKTGKKRFVDTLGLACPFLARYGRVYGKPEYMTLAVHELGTYRERGLVQGLPMHCYDAESGLPIGIIGWGRGAGWYMLGLSDTMDELPDGDEKHEVRGWLIEEADRLMAFERKDGGFSATLQTMEQYESSATAMLGYVYAHLADISGEKKYRDVAERCLGRLRLATRGDGAVDECQGDTIAPGIMSERYAEMPFAQGMTLRLIAALAQRAH